MSVKLVLECRDGWRYQEGNRVIAYFVGEVGTRVDASYSLLWTWNTYWAAYDHSEGQWHTWHCLRIDRESVLINAAESYTMEDFAADLEGLIAVPIVCIDGQAEVQRGKQFTL